MQRRGVQLRCICYERFVAVNASRINCGGSPYPATAELVTWCVLWTIDVSRERHARAAANGGVAALRNFKGTSGNAQIMKKVRSLVADAMESESLTPAQVRSGGVAAREIAVDVAVYQGGAQ